MQRKQEKRIFLLLFWFFFLGGNPAPVITATHTPRPKHRKSVLIFYRVAGSSSIKYSESCSSFKV